MDSKIEDLKWQAIAKRDAEWEKALEAEACFVSMGINPCREFIAGAFARLSPQAVEKTAENSAKPSQETREQYYRALDNFRLAMGMDFERMLAYYKAQREAK